MEERKVGKNIALKEVTKGHYGIAKWTGNES